MAHRATHAGYACQSARIVSRALALLSMAVLVAVGLGVAPGLSETASADIHNVPTATGALAGKTVVVSPGHGANPSGVYDRGVLHGLREDIHTNELVTVWLQRYLANAGARVFMIRERTFNTSEVIVDNTDSGYSETGSWSLSTSATDFYGSDYRVHSVTAGGPSSAATATWTPTFPASGEYPVYMWFAPSGNRAIDATVTINHPGGQSSLTVNQQLYHGSWIHLGEWWFNAGSDVATGSVTISSHGGDTAQYVIADAVRFGGGYSNLPHGYDRWKDDGLAHTETLGYPNTPGYGDVSVRPRYAGWMSGLSGTNWTNDWRYLAIHSNAAGTQPNTTARGTSTFSYSNGRPPAWGSSGSATHPTSLQNASDSYAANVQDQFVADMRANWWSGWPDRNNLIMNFGELRSCEHMPSALIELCFHDHADDAGVIRQDRWRHDAARALYKAIARDFMGAGVTILPLPPTHVRVTQSTAGSYTIAWNEQLDSNEPSAAPTGYKIYRSPDGRSWDDGVDVTGTSTTLSAATNEVVFVRVAATNAGGESMPSQALAVRVAGGDSHGGVLLVYGFDRQFIYVVTDISGHDDPTNSLERYRDDYIAAPALAIAGNTSMNGVPFDSCMNEAIEAGQVDLKDYHCVIWLTGEESTADESFSTAEQNAVNDYLTNAANANLFVSGAEVGWDLSAQGTTADRTFFNMSLAATYVSDDAATHGVVGVAGTAFAGLNATFGDGTSGAYGDYNVDYPDVLDTSNGSVVVMNYDNGAGAAAVLRESGSVRVLMMGFPYERLLGNAQQSVMNAVMSVMLSDYSVPSGSTPSGSGGCGASPVATQFGGASYALVVLLGLALIAIRRRA